MTIQSTITRTNNTNPTAYFVVVALDATDPEFGGWSLRENGMQIALMTPWSGGYDVMIPEIADALEIDEDDVLDVAPVSVFADTPPTAWEVTVQL